MWAGAVFPTPALSIFPEMVIRKHLTIRGVHNYAPQDLAAALSFLSQMHQNYPFSDLVGQEFPLSEVKSALEYACRERPFRVAVRTTS